MARPTTKDALITAANEQFNNLWMLIDSMPNGAQETVFNFGDDLNKKEAHWTRDKNLRDVLIHLYEWHQLLLDWVRSNQNGEVKPFLPEPYNWKTYAGMNVEFWRAHQATAYNASKDMLRDSHQQVMMLIGQFSDEALFTKKYFPWAGASSLGSYCVSATSSHYDWAIKKVKLHTKTYGQ